jgi:NAD(P)-dependent dehydrogenase (short-subunit alcohol dehydrogenase family)
MDSNNAPSRRQVMGGIATGVASAMAAPALTQGSGTAAPMPQSTLRDPTTEYPKPPFPRQHQDPPGLASEMTPRPDHGEHSYRGSGRLAGRKALVTGGDSGIGRAAAIAFAREGADVAINYLIVEESDAQEVLALIRAEGRRAVAIPGDIRTEAFCQQLVAEAVQALGGLDIVVNNAGKQHSVDRIEDLPSDQFDATFKTNVYAMFWITKAAMAHLPPGAAIINTASVEAYAPDPNLLDYAPTTAAIVAFTKSLAKQVAQRGVRVNAVAPGPFWTPLQVSGGQPMEKLETFGEDTPIGRAGQPAEIAPVYVLLASAEASDTTGQVYGASGGRGNP